VRPNRKLNLAMGFLLALFVSVGTAFGLSYFDNSIRTGSDIERQLNIPVIVAIPEGEWMPRLLEEGASEIESTSDT
jgi:capsular polysaccharide biosynthesis protein